MVEPQPQFSGHFRSQMLLKKMSRFLPGSKESDDYYHICKTLAMVRGCECRVNEGDGRKVKVEREWKSEPQQKKYWVDIVHWIVKVNWKIKRGQFTWAIAGDGGWGGEGGRGGKGNGFVEGRIVASVPSNRFSKLPFLVLCWASKGYSQSKYINIACF